MHTEKQKMLRKLYYHYSYYLLCLYVASLLFFEQGLCTRADTWQELVSSNGVKFIGRNAHASCVFQGKIWVTGGRSASYTDYNLLTSYKRADVWYTDISGSDDVWDGLWLQQEKLTGDYFAQNIDVVQPGEIAPWYARYGHTLNAIDINNDGEDDLMILTGGYSPSPSNDVWVTEDGNNWIYTGLAPWSPRAWHASTVFQGKLWLMGGTPLNNEVWMLANVTKISRDAPLTRSLYNNYTYQLDWIQFPNVSSICLTLIIISLMTVITYDIISYHMILYIGILVTSSRYVCCFSILL
jgi:hypothetical protein